MPRISLSGFRDPARRPRYIVWAGAAVLVAAALAIVAMGLSSTRWFCSEACHKVQDDTIEAYRRSSHRNISCMACHMPVNADPLTFTLHKAEALGELYMTVTNGFELPLNAESEVALEMPAAQCTQCHDMENRHVTPSTGILIDHKVHSDEGIACPVCHNRVGHKEDFDLALKNPKSGEPNRKHDDFTSMDACFRCHSQEKGGRAPGTCSACHSEGFDLRPANHDAGTFVRDATAKRAIHADLGKKDFARVAAYEKKSTEVEPAAGENGGEAHELPKVSSVSYCGTCHETKTFCTGCHGVEMPHPAGFGKGHGTVGKKSPGVCANCHSAKGAAKVANTEFCNGCHHREGNPNKPWIPQHFDVVRAKGADACFECHDPTFCAKCHVRGLRD